MPPNVGVFLLVWEDKLLWLCYDAFHLGIVSISFFPAIFPSIPCYIYVLLYIVIYIVIYALLYSERGQWQQQLTVATSVYIHLFYTTSEREKNKSEQIHCSVCVIKCTMMKIQSCKRNNNNNNNNNKIREDIIR